MAALWTIQRVLAWTSEFFERKGVDNARLTAELLLAETLGCDRVRLYIDFDRPLNKDELAGYRALVERRAGGEPTYYITGRREFFGRSFLVDPRVLVPRPETEHLIEAALERLPSGAKGPLLDLCTGSGCVGLTLAAERAGLTVVATDVAPGALQVARANAVRLAVEGRVELLQGDLFAPVVGRRFAMVVSNPPYVPSAEIDGLSLEVKREPRGALDGGPDGLDFVRRIAEGTREILEPGGWLLLEIGDGQGLAARAILEGVGLCEAEVRPDLAGLDRLALARQP